MKNLDFDSIIDEITSKPEDQDINMAFIDFKDVYKGPAKLTVRRPDGNTITVSCLKGQSLRTVLTGVGIDVYNGKAKITNCGGGGICGTCVVSVIPPVNDWEPRPAFEAKKLRRYDEFARLSCNTIVEGDCEVIVSPPKVE